MPCRLPSLLTLALCLLLAGPSTAQVTVPAGDLHPHGGTGEPTGPLGILRGRVVMDREREIPLRSVAIEACPISAPTLAQDAALTDDQGRFALQVQPGTYVVRASLAYVEPTSNQARAISNYPGALATDTWSVAPGGVNELPLIVFPEPVFLHSGFNSSWQVWTVENGVRGLFEYLLADPFTDAAKRAVSGPGGQTVSVPSFAVVRIPNESEALPGQLGYNQGTLAQLGYSYTWHNTNASRFKLHIDRLDLSQYVADTSQIRPSIVAHSMGGLITRALVTSHSTLIEDIVCYDTPHGGTNYLTPPPALDEVDLNGWYGSVCGLFSCGPYAFYTPAWNVNHTELSNQGRRWLLYECDPDTIVGPNSTVSGGWAPAWGAGRRHRYSQIFGVWVWDNSWTWWTLMGGSAPLVKSRVGDTHAGIHHNPDRHRETALWLTYGKAPPAVAAPPALGPSAPPPAEQARLVLVAEAEPEETVTVPFHPGSGALDLSVLVEPAAAGLEVFDADGVLLQDLPGPEGLRAFRLQPGALDAGAYLLALTAPPDARASMRATLTFPGAPALQVGVQSTLLGAGEPVVLAARIAAPDLDPFGPWTGAAAPGARFTATVTRPDGSTERAALADDGAHPDELAGDGIWSAVLLSTELEGPYAVHVHALDPLPAGALERSARTSFVVQPTGAAFAGAPRVELAETAAGAPGDLRVTAALALERAGRFRLRARLEDATGTLLHVPATVVEAPGPGLHATELLVPAAALAGAPAPWTLRDLAIDDQDLGGLRVAELAPLTVPAPHRAR